MSVTIEPLKPKEKRILITKYIGDIHEHLMESQTYFRGFIATGTWMPISHMTTRPFPRDTQNVVPEDMAVSLQHCKEHIYAERCSRDKVLAAVEIIWDEETRLRLGEERVPLMEQAVIDAKVAETQPFVEKAFSRLMELKASLQRMATQDQHRIHAATGFETFIIGGSWMSMLVQKAIDLIFEDDTTFQTVQLKANGIDVYHGEFAIDEDNVNEGDTTSSEKNLRVDMNAIEYKAVEGFTLEVNTVQCRNLSAKNFLKNNDINVTASCLHVDFSKDELFELHVALQF